MPFASFKSVREVSSEDINCPAENLIKSTGKKWKTKACGERLGFVVLELSEPSKITGIDIGNEHSAFIEVLVSNTSCSPNDFTEILVTCSFMTLIESKNSTNINRVRCFSPDALISTTLSKKWQFIKIICSQPFNKHVQYGISFIKIHVDSNVDIKKIPQVSEKLHSKVENPSSLNISQLGKFKLREESPDSDSESSASLFKRWKASEMNSETHSLKNTTEILQKPIETEKLTLKTVQKLSNNYDLMLSTDRNRRELAFGNEENNDDERIYKKRQRLSEAIELEREQLRKRNESSTSKDNKKELKRAGKIDENKKLTNYDKAKNDPTKQKINKEEKKCDIRGKIFRPFDELLKGTVLVISGIQNPERSNLRDKALSMGAKYRADWGNGCTHLICAFKNTPKYNQVRGKGKIVTRAWIEDCHKQKKYLPWRRYALDSNDLTQPESEDEVLDESLRPAQPSSDSNVTKNSIANAAREISTVSSGSDTDDDIQRVLENNANKNKEKQGTVSHSKTVFDLSTEEEVYLTAKTKLDANMKSLFNGLIFFICSDIRSAERKRIENIIKLNQGLITLCPKEAELFISIGEAIESKTKNGKVIKPDWIYESIDMEMKVPLEKYLL
ncbi:DNA repair protein XRCC1 isoform X2 [Ceratitis capitata]|uniref:DNA repair protein XRCC1 n=1 Tax=Ceratitis capitata TaxID=7213 RepID=W8C961_CERCA|nr:DNA repair protein XRCC1 isoform X2 [Ceratitis capitata]